MIPDPSLNTETSLYVFIYTSYKSGFIFFKIMFIFSFNSILFINKIAEYNFPTGTWKGI